MSVEVTDFGGHVLASWGHRELVLRAHVETAQPTHVQYGGEGTIVIVSDAVETLFHAPGPALPPAPVATDN